MEIKDFKNKGLYSPNILCLYITERSSVVLDIYFLAPREAKRRKTSSFMSTGGGREGKKELF